MASCIASHGRDDQTVDAPPPYANWPDPLLGMPHGAEQTRAVCGRPGDDPVRDAFCAENPPTLTGLTDLQAALGIDGNSVTKVTSFATGHVVALSVTSHSTALAARSVSAINPRVLVVRADIQGLQALDQLQFTVLAFTRGEQFVELVARDRGTREPRFYLIGFRQACNAESHGCTPGDLLTPAIERDWIETSLYDESDLKNTVLDCAPCHQPDGPGTHKLLRMQEIDSPWTHWFSTTNEGGRALLEDYAAAKGDEPLAGMTSEQIGAADPNLIATLTLAVSPQSPSPFDSLKIEDEVRQSAAARGGNQPADNAVPGESPTWQAAYRYAQQSGTLALPYHDVKVTDPVKLARNSDAYRAFVAGEIERDALPDVRDIYPDDPERLAKLGFATDPGLDGEGVLIQACTLCHNGRLDPTLSRARFRADLVGMSRAEKDLAIARLMLPASDPLAMPPARLRVLSDEARIRAIEALRR